MNDVPGITRPAAASTDGGRRWPRWAMLWLVALIAVTISVRQFDPTPWLGSDDASYHAAAEHVLAGKTMTRVHHHYGRLSAILAVAGSMALFGNNVTAVVLPTIVLSVVCVLFVVALGRIVWGWWVGLCAGSIVAVMPYYRVLSTTAYPDVHACFWATLAALMIVCAVRTGRHRTALLYAAGAGVALGMAASAKIFAGWSIVGLAAIALTAADRSRRHRIEIVIATLAGGCLFGLVHGLTYWVLADDFWFKLHALTSAQGQSNLFPSSGDPFAVGPLTFLQDRMTFLLHPMESGWGWLALAFWPAAIYVLISDKRGRPFAIWAIGAYLLVAFFPVSFSRGVRPYPSFVGRNILFVCVPFALCVSATVFRLATIVRPQRVIQSTWPVTLGLILGVAYANAYELRNFRNRLTSRIGTAMTRLIADGTLDNAPEIHMTASMYWRFRVLFPEPLRSRLRVSTDDTTPKWWRATTTDIVDRQVAGVPASSAMLVATPTQLSGEPERWDYGVALATRSIESWKQSMHVGVVDRDGTIRRDGGEDREDVPLLILRRYETTITERKLENAHDSDIG